ncbi:MAG TPA: RNA polymerase sigma factor RpoH [Gammaproteobacteria bacterium]|nr:RNA polymerase sigma factor RpoH [Gammaproteobacteria bacterium]
MSTKLPALTNIELPANSIDAYIQRANSVPMLTKEQEYELAKQWQEEQNLQAAQGLVLSHLRYVIRVAKNYMGYGLNLADLIQEGTIGLMKAVKKFEPEREVRLVTFAMHWIKAEIHEYIIKNWRIVKIATTKAQRKLFFKLRSKKKDLTWLTNAEIAEIARDLGVKEKEVIQMEARMAFDDTAFDLPDDDDGQDRISYSPVEYLEHKSASPEQELVNDNWQDKVQTDLQAALKRLDARSLYILQRRWLNDDESKATLEELAQHFSVSKERIRQIEAKAMGQIKEQIAVDTEE